MEPKHKVTKTIKTLFMSWPAFQVSRYQSKSMILKPGYPVGSPEAFCKNTDTRVPLPESDFIGVDQKPGAGDSRVFQREILECSRHWWLWSIPGWELLSGIKNVPFIEIPLRNVELSVTGCSRNKWGLHHPVSVKNTHPLTLKPWF